MPRRDPLAGHAAEPKRDRPAKSSPRKAPPAAKPVRAVKARAGEAKSLRVKPIVLRDTPEDLNLLLHGPTPASALHAAAAAKSVQPAPVSPPPTAAETEKSAARSRPIPPERLLAYQLGYLSLMAKLLFAVLFGLLMVLQLPYRSPAAGIESTPGAAQTATLAGAGQSTPGENRTQTLPTMQASSQPSAFYEPAGCEKPDDNYDIVVINGVKLSRRTQTMLKHAAELYGGSIDLRGSAILKGGYLGAAGETAAAPGDAHSATHLGGGVVDLAITDPKSGTVVFKEVEPIIRALRAAGFAAWYRDQTSGFNPHIHAVAIGDSTLSPEALSQLTGEAGYFRGLNGLSGARTGPDSHGHPIVCSWMIQAGFSDLRPALVIAKDSVPNNHWRDDLRRAAESYITSTADETAALARRIGWTGSGNEDASNMCGPLSAAILRDAGLLPIQAWPANYLKESFWLASPRVSGRPWIFFPQEEFDVFRYGTPINQFDFESQPLCPGDFLYTYADPKKGGDEHMLVVSEVDAKGRAYSVTNVVLVKDPGSTSVFNGTQTDTYYLVQRVLLYDPGNPDQGVFRSDWVTDIRRLFTGLGGFDVLRHRGACVNPGALLGYTVRPGETLPEIAARYHTTVGALLAANPLDDPTRLAAGQLLQLPVNVTLESSADGPSSNGK